MEFGEVVRRRRMVRHFAPDPVERSVLERIAAAAQRAPSAGPQDYTPVGVIPVGRPLSDKKSPSLKRGWRSVDEFARWETW